MPMTNLMAIVALLCVSRSVVSDSLRAHDLSMEFSRPECWSGLPFPSLEDLSDPGIEPRFSALQADSLPSELEPYDNFYNKYY